MDLLPRLFGQEHCPRAVLSECLHSSVPKAVRHWAAQPPAWLIIEDLAAADLDLAHLDEGAEMAHHAPAAKNHADSRIAR